MAAAAKGSSISVSDLFARAEELTEEKREVLDAILGVRDALRNLDRAGLLSDEESDKLAEVFPERSRNRGNGADSE